MTGAWPLAFQASANSFIACWLVSEPTPMMSAVVGVNVVSSGSTAAEAGVADSAMAEPARVVATTPARILRTDILVRFL